MQQVNPVPVPQTPQELDRAIQQYRNSNWQGQELFLHWQAIRLSSLAQSNADVIGDQVPGEDSY